MILTFNYNAIQQQNIVNNYQNALLLKIILLLNILKYKLPLELFYPYNNQDTRRLQIIIAEKLVV